MEVFFWYAYLICTGNAAGTGEAGSSKSGSDDDGNLFVVFYVGIESILVLNRDLKTKQSYMLWMVPKSIWEILGSKFLAAILQMLIVFVMYVAVGLICILVTLQHTGHLSDLFKMIWQAGELYIDGLPSIIWGSAEIFLGWTVVIMAGFVGVILSRTLLLNAKYSGFLAVVVFLQSLLPWRRSMI